MKKLNKRKLYFPLIGILVLASFFISSCRSMPTQKTVDFERTEEELVVHYIDVGQGDSTLIELPNDEIVLIDGGTRGAGETVAKYLNDLHIEHLDYLIATHPHEDHIGGLVQIVKNYSIGQIFMPKVNHSTQVYENFLQAIADKDYRVSSPSIGEKIIDEEHLSMNVLAPHENISGTNLNNYSIANRLIYGETTFLFTGDAEKKSEENMVESGHRLKADVLKIGHHGGDTSSIESFLKKVDADYGVISAGLDNQYGHPHQNVLDRLEKQGVSIFRTDQDGTIVARSDGQEITFNKKEREATKEASSDLKEIFEKIYEEVQFYLEN